MRLLTRTTLAVVGLALAGPASTWADPPAPAGAPHKHPRGLFGKEKLCADCQRAKLQSQGISIPPPPSLPTGTVTTSVGGECTACQNGQYHEHPGVISEGVPVANSGSGYAVVGGDAAPGYAVVGGEGPVIDPSPIGVVQARPNQVGPQAGPRTADSSVMQTSIPAPDPVKPLGSNRPRILSHLFGVSAIGRDYREERQRKRGQEHASIRYDNQPTQVKDLPASQVYGRKGGH